MYRSTLSPLPPHVGRAAACALGLCLGGGAAQAEGSPADIIVTGRPGEEKVGLGKITTSTIDTPQAITAIGREELEQRGVNTLTDALRIVPGISLGAGETSWQSTLR